MTKQITANEYVRKRIVRLSHESQWPPRLIAHALDLNVSIVYGILTKYKKHGEAMLTDRRQFNRGAPKRTSKEDIDLISSHEML